MRISGRSWTLAVGLACLAAAPGAAEPRITRPAVSVAEGHVRVSFALEEAFGPEVRERIAAGLPTAFRYRIELLRDRKRWWDDGLEDTVVEVVALFNAVTREYLVNTKRNGRLEESRLAGSLAELETHMTRFTDLPAFTLAEAPRDTRLLVRVRAETGTRTLLSMVPTKVTTGWRESKKFRIPS